LQYGRLNVPAPEVEVLRSADRTQALDLAEWRGMALGTSEWSTVDFLLNAPFQE
jgi:hypothetical protein